MSRLKGTFSYEFGLHLIDILGPGKTRCQRVRVTGHWSLDTGKLYAVPSAHTRPLSTVIFLVVESAFGRDRSTKKNSGFEIVPLLSRPCSAPGGLTSWIIFMKWKKYRDTRKIRLRSFIDRTTKKKTKISHRDSYFWVLVVTELVKYRVTTGNTWSVDKIERNFRIS